MYISITYTNKPIQSPKLNRTRWFGLADDVWFGFYFGSCKANRHPCLTYVCMGLFVYVIEMYTSYLVFESNHGIANNEKYDGIRLP